MEEKGQTLKTLSIAQEELNKINMDFNEKDSSKTILLNLKLKDGTFLLTYANDNFLDFFVNLDSSCIGESFFNIFDPLKDLGIENIAFDVLKSSERVFILKIFSENQLKYSLSCKFLKTEEDSIILTLEYDGVNISKYYADNFSPVNSVKAVAIYQDNKIVYANNYFSESVGVPLDKIMGFKLNNLNYNHIESLNSDFKTNLNQVLNKEKMFEENFINFKFKGETKKIKLFFSAADYLQRPAVQITCMDLSDSNLMSEQVFDARSEIKLICDLSNIATFNWKKGKNLVNWSSSFLDILDISQEEYFNFNGPLIESVYQFVIPEDKKRVNEDIKKSRENHEDFSSEFRIMAKSGDIKHLQAYSQRDYSEKGDVFGSKGYIQDITEIKNYENSLKKIIHDKNILLSELHHRVKNNLQVLLSLLNLETRFNGYDPEDTLNKTRDRIKTLALTFDMVYSSEDISHINLKNFFDHFIPEIFEKNNLESVETRCNIVDIDLEVEIAIPLVLVIDELLINYIKHADFGFRKDYFLEIVASEIDDDEVVLTIGINGAVIPNEILYGDGLKNSALSIVYILVDQLEANLNIHPSLNSTYFELVFPKSLNYNLHDISEVFEDD